MNRTDYDVVIIGGGPAGAIAGINLARAGLSTVIIERKIFPRETLCGEFLSIEVTNHIKELELFDKFLSLNPNSISSFQFITKMKSFSTGLPFEGYSLKRSIFDNFLLTEAKRTGAVIFQPAEVKDVIKGTGAFTTHFISAGRILEISSRFVIGAFGKRNFIDKKLGRHYSNIQSGYNGIKFHIRKELLSHVNDSCIYIFSGNKIYCGINTVSREEATVCFLSRKRTGNASAPIYFVRLMEENKQLAALFNNQFPDLKKHEIYGAGNIYFGNKELVKDGIIMIGDAAKVIAPLAGDGIGMAFQSAKIAAGIIIKYNKEVINFTEIEQIYKSKWKQQFAKRTRVARIVQSIILQKKYLNLIPEGVIQRLIPSLISATRN
jgi:flavin-dependent dehydrogenase